jgi:uncharacterized protein
MTTTKLPFQIPNDELNAFCKENHIQKLSLFGSVLRQDFQQNSDVDVLVEFEPGHVPGYKFIGIEKELSLFFRGRPVDLVTPKFLNHRIRQQILQSAEVLYAQG